MCMCKKITCNSKQYMPPGKVPSLTYIGVLKILILYDMPKAKKVQIIKEKQTSFNLVTKVEASIGYL